MSIMAIGAILLTGAYGPTDQIFLSVFCFSLFFYGACVRACVRGWVGGWVGCASNRFFMDVECMGCATLVFSGGGRRRLGGRQRRWVAKTPAEACLR